MCFGSSRESSHRDDSFGYLQHVIFVDRLENLTQIMDVLLCIDLDMCFGYSWELSRGGDSFWCPQHMILVAKYEK